MNSLYLQLSSFLSRSRVGKFPMLSLLFVALLGGVFLVRGSASRAADATSSSASSSKKGAVNDYGFRQVKFINEQIASQWTDNGILPSPPATDPEWCRRVYLDVIGRVPSVPELHKFVTSKDPLKRAKLVDSLLNDDEYVDEYARNWTTIWTNILIGPEATKRTRLFPVRACKSTCVIRLLAISRTTSWCGSWFPQLVAQLLGHRISTGRRIFSSASSTKTPPRPRP
jgi:hypothetical protein